jgi:5-enolpyruvylshikimate-3-phosphate synthase
MSNYREHTFNVLHDFNAKVENESWNNITVGGHNLNDESHGNGDSQISSATADEDSWNVITM